MPLPIPTGTHVEAGLKKAILRLVKGGPERLAIEAGQIDAIIDPATGNAILLPEAQRALIERKVGFRNLIGLAFDWYWEQDARYCFVSHRGAADDTRGFGQEDIIGKPLWDWSIDNLSETDWRTHRQQLEWRATFRDLEVRLMDCAGEVRYLSLSGEPIFDDQDQFKGYRGITRDITARKHSQIQAQESNRFAGIMLESLGSPIALLDQAGVVLASNQAWREFSVAHSGVGAAVAPGSNYLAACDGAAGNDAVDGSAIGAGIRQVIAGERAVFCYDCAFDPPAERRWYALRISGIAEDVAARALVSFEDITERKRNELLLGLEHRVLRCLADAGNAANALKSVIRAVCETQGWNCGRYFSLDPSAGVLRFSESWGIPLASVDRFLEKSCGLVFRSDAGLVGRVCQSGQPLWLLHGMRDSGLWPMALAPETGEDRACLFPVIHEDRTIGVLAFSSRNVREPDDRMLQAVQLIGRELGHFLLRQNAIDALRRSEQRFRVLNDLTSDWYWEQDRDFRFTQVVGCSPFGTTEILGLTHWELPNVVLAEEQWAKHRSHLAAHWSFCDFEFTAVLADGVHDYYAICGEPVYDDAGMFAGYCGTGLDITPRKRAEIALRDSEARLRVLAGLSPD
jgi:PAS domain S-box-containing protein